ncbi:MAG: universal stress protein [Caldilineaceae bacterium]
MSDQEQSARNQPGGEDIPLIRRIVVALDGATQSTALLEAAAQLAARLGVELVGLFVEDVNLLRLAELPFTQEVGSFSTLRRTLPSVQLERQLRAQANRLRRMVRVAAERHQVDWSFAVMRGPIATELRRAAMDSDLVILGRSQRMRRGRLPLGSTTRAVIIQAPGMTLVLHRTPVWQQPLIVVYDGSDAAQRALALATQLTQADNMPLLVVLVSDEQDDARALRHAVASWLHQRGQLARYRWLARAQMGRLLNLVFAEQGGALLLPTGDLSTRDAALLTLLDDLQCPVLLVR